MIALISHNQRKRFAQVVQILSALILCLVASGCVVSKMVVKSDPEGATVHFDDEDKGITPASFTFDFYGNREIKLEKDGYQTKRELVRLKPPLYARFPLDIFFDLLLPFKITDKHTYTCTLSPIKPADTQKVLRRGEALRQEAITSGR